MNSAYFNLNEKTIGQSDQNISLTKKGELVITSRNEPKPHKKIAMGVIAAQDS